MEMSRNILDEDNIIRKDLRLFERKKMKQNLRINIIIIFLLLISMLLIITISFWQLLDLTWVIFFFFSLVIVLQLNIKSSIKEKYSLMEKQITDSYERMKALDIRSRKEKKKPKLVDSSHPFYYLDNKIVSELYPKIISREKIKYIDESERRVLKTDIRGKFLIAEGGFDKTNFIETKRHKDVVDSPLIQYEKIESYLYRKNQLNFNLEKFETDETKVNELKDIFNTIYNKFRIDIPEKENYLIQVTNAYAEDELNKFPEVSGYIYLTAEFTVYEKNDVHVLLEYRHPITDSLEDQDPPVKLQIKCVNENIEEFGNSTFELNKSNKITCLGQIIRWTFETRVFEIYPIAIY